MKNGKFYFANHMAVVWTVIEQLEEYSNNSPYQNIDIRKTIFGYYSTCLKNYYDGFSCIGISQIIKNNCSAKTKSNIKNAVEKAGVKTSLGRFIFLADQTNAAEYIKNLWRQLFVETWFVFDSSIKVLFEAGVKDKKKNQDKKTIPFFQALYEEIKPNYDRDFEADKELLELYAACRNSFHSNGLATRTKEYKLRWGSFYTYKNYPIGFKEPDAIFALLKELIAITKLIVEKLDSEKVIIDPVKEQQSGFYVDGGIPPEHFFKKKD